MPTPAELLGITGPNAIWKLTLPTGSQGHPTELSGAALAAADIPTTFWVGAEGAVHFRAAVNGVTTSNSGNPRSELRELNADGSLASWSSTDGKTHTMVIDQAVTHLPNPRSSGTAGVVCGQIHDSTNDISVFRVEQGKIWVTNGNDTHYAVADSNYQLGTRFRAMFVVVGGKISAYYNGKLITTIPVKGSGWYFRAGCYTQANAGNSKPGDATNYGESCVWSVTVAHGAPLPGSDQVPAPVPTPAPAPTPTPVPTVKPIFIQVIRHGNKDDNADGKDDNAHALSVIGRARALAIRDQGLFINPRADLAKAQYVFASGPPPTRMVETAKPTADALSLPIDASLNSEVAVTQTAQLLAKQALAGKVVLAVLEHSCIAAVASALVKTLGGKWNAKPPSSWADSDFSSIWLFVGDGKGNWTFSKTDEGVLKGDPGWHAPAPVPVPVPVPPPVVVPPTPVPDPVPVPPPVVVPSVVVDPAPPVIPTPPPVPPPIVPEPPVTPPTPVPSSPPVWWADFLAWLQAKFGAKP